MASKKSNQYEVVTHIRHDGELKSKGEIVEIEHEFTAKTLIARGVIKPAGKKADPEQPKPGEADPGMPPADIKENDPGSEKVRTEQ